MAALIDSILLIDGPAINLSKGIDKIIIKNIKVILNLQLILEFI